MNLSHTEEAMATQLGKTASQFMRIGKRFVVNMNYIYQVNILKQQLILSDYDHFAFQISVSKDALRKMKDLMLITKV
jgi:DNA-binding LytR/AlgR family response regulator